MPNPTLHTPFFPLFFRLTSPIYVLQRLYTHLLPLSSLRLTSPLSFSCNAGSDMLRDLIENLKSLDRADARFPPLVQQITANFGTCLFFTFSPFPCQHVHHVNISTISVV